MVSLTFGMLLSFSTPPFFRLVGNEVQYFIYRFAFAKAVTVEKSFFFSELFDSP